jgi:glycosyltransferase involved in cell wall biosynthesis
MAVWEMAQQDSRQGRTLVIIPAYNEEVALLGVLDDIHLHCPRHDILVVDDGSQDRTADVARRAGAAVAPLPFNLGIGGALRTGFRYAVAQGYEQAIQFDADGQHDAAEIGKLLEAVDQGADLAIGSRFARSRVDYQVGRVRWGAMRAMRLGVRLLSGKSFSDTSSGFRAFSRTMLEYFARTYPVEYLDSVEALLLACYAGFRVVEVPALMRQRTAGIPSNRSVKLLYHYLRLMIVMLSTASWRGRRTREVPA